MDSSGNVYIADTGNNRVVKMPWSGSAFSTPVTVASGLSSPQGVAVDSSLNVYITDTGNNRVIKVLWSGSAYGAVAVLASGLSAPVGVAVDTSLNVYIADTGNNRVLEIPWSGSAYGTQTTVIDGLSSVTWLAVYKSSRLYMSVPSQVVAMYLSTGSSAGSYSASAGIAVDPFNTLYSSHTASNSLTANGNGAEDTLVTGLTAPTGVAAGIHGEIVYANAGTGVVTKLSQRGDFGTVSLGSSLTAAQEFYFTSSTTLGSTTAFRAVTQGIAGLDFNVASGGTCTAGATYSAGESCTVNVAFTPTRSGARTGAVLLMNGSTVLATGYLPGNGSGPQMVFIPATTAAYFGASMLSYVAVDDGDNFYYLGGLLDLSPSKYSMSDGTDSLVSGTAASSMELASLAVDGRGNVLTVEHAGTTVYGTDKTPATLNTGYVVRYPWNGSSYGAPGEYELGTTPVRVVAGADGSVYTFDTSGSYLNVLPYVRLGYGRIHGSGYIISGTSISGIAPDRDDNLFYLSGTSVYKLPWTQGAWDSASTVLEGVPGGSGMTMDGTGNLYFISSSSVFRVPWTGSAYGPAITLATGSCALTDLAVDGQRNVYVADSNFSDTDCGGIKKINQADPPSLSFGSLAVGETSTQTLTLQNVGNTALSFAVPSSGSNPSLSDGFTLTRASTCPQLSSSSASTGTLAVGSSCTYVVSFTDSAHSLTISQANATLTPAAATTTYKVASQTLVLSATVKSSGTSLSEGTVTFTVLDSTGTTTIGTAVTSTTVASGAASVTYTMPAATAIGSYTIQAAYSGSSNYAASSDSSHVLTVAGVATATTASTTSTYYYYHSGSQPAYLKATISSSDGTVSEGTVTFTLLSGGVVYGSATTSGTVSNGTVTTAYTLPAGLVPGHYTVQAVYSGGAHFSTSTGTGTLTLKQNTMEVTPGDVTTAFSTAAQSVTLPVTLSPTYSTTVNEGTVTFSVRNKGTLIGTAVTSATVSSSSTSVSYTIPASTAPGTYAIAALYNGTSGFAQTSGNATLNIGTASTVATAAAATAAYSAAAQNVTLAATVASSGGTVNEGAVTFTLLSGSTTIGTAVTSATVSGGAASVSYALPAGAAAGSYIIQAVYSGGTYFAGSTDTSHSLTVIAPATTVVSYSVIFGSQSYTLGSTARTRLPWKITGLRVVFSDTITTADASSLGGIAATGFSGLGTNTLTWTFNAVTKASLTLTLGADSSHPLVDANGTALSTVSQALRVLCGDVDDDGYVASADMTLVNKARSATYNLLYDINGDGAVNATDVVLVKSLIGNSL